MPFSASHELQRTHSQYPRHSPIARGPPCGMVLLAGLVLCATLLPLSMTLNRAAPPHCPDARREVGDESSQLAVLAQLAQRNEELLRDLANTENGSSPTRLSPVRERPPEDAEAAAVASLRRAGVRQLYREKYPFADKEKARAAVWNATAAAAAAKALGVAAA